jgi:hypothetical protein
VVAAAAVIAKAVAAVAAAAITEIVAIAAAAAVTTEIINRSKISANEILLITRKDFLFVVVDGFGFFVYSFSFASILKDFTKFNLQKNNYAASPEER